MYGGAEKDARRASSSEAESQIVCVSKDMVDLYLHQTMLSWISALCNSFNSKMQLARGHDKVCCCALVQVVYTYMLYALKFSGTKVQIEDLFCRMLGLPIFYYICTYIMYVYTLY